MKNSYYLFISIFLIICLLTPVVVFAESSVTKDNETELAKDAGQNYISALAEIDASFAHWQDAKLTSPQKYHDLENNVIAYMFAISKNKKVVGRILVGSSLYDYHILEAGLGVPYVIPGIDDSKSLLEKDLGLEIDVKDIPTPNRLVYLGYGQPYAIIQVDKQSIGINIDHGYAVDSRYLESYLMPSNRYKIFNDTKDDAESKYLMSYDNLSNFPWKGQLDHSWNSRAPLCPYCPMNVDGDCGPTTGVMIAAYYYSQGYTNFSAAASTSYPVWVETAHHDLYDLMETGQDQTTYWYDFRDGWLDYAQSKGYNNFDAKVANEGDSYNQWLDITSAIAEDDPLGVLFTNAPYAQSHYCAIVGWYAYFTQKWIHVYNPYSNGYTNPPPMRNDVIDFIANSPDMLTIWIDD